jgi:trigger factor
VIGQALPNDELQPQIDWDHAEVFTFVLDVILTPKVELNLTADDHIPDKQPKIGKKDKEEYVASLRKQHDLLPDAELNQEFFDRVLGPDQANTPEEFMKKVEERMRREFASESNYRFIGDARDYLINKCAIELPDTLIKRWLHQSNEGKFPMEEIERDYDLFARDFRWQLIRGHLIKENNIQINREEIMDQAVMVAHYQFAMYGLNTVPQEHLERYAERLLSNEKESRRIIEMLEDLKVVALVRSRVTLDPEKIPFSKIRELNVR